MLCLHRLAPTTFTFQLGVEFFEVLHENGGQSGWRWVINHFYWKGRECGTPWRLGTKFLCNGTSPFNETMNKGSHSQLMLVGMIPSTLMFRPCSAPLPRDPSNPCQCCHRRLRLGRTVSNSDSPESRGEKPWWNLYTHFFWWKIGSALDSAWIPAPFEQDSGKVVGECRPRR